MLIVKIAQKNMMNDNFWSISFLNIDKLNNKLEIAPYLNWILSVYQYF